MKVGSYSYPLYRLNALLKDTRKIYETFGQKEVSRDHIAQILGQAADSGAFGQKLADLKAYGLLLGSHGNFRISEIGIKSTYGTISEKSEALDKAVKNIELWNAIFKKWGPDPNIETFWLDLSEIAGIERSESKNKADSVRKAYTDDGKYLLLNKTPEETANLRTNDSSAESLGVNDGNSDMNAIIVQNQAIENLVQPVNQPPTTQINIPINTKFVGYIGFPDYSKAPLEIKDEMSYQIAKQLLKAIKKKLEENGIKFDDEDK